MTMARFQFRLAALLQLREAVRDERRSHLAEAFRLADSLEAQRRQFLDNLHELNQQRSVATGLIDVDRLLAASRYEAVLMLEIRNLERQQAAVATEIEKRREALVEADRDVRSLEQLREAQHERHREEQERRSMKVLDEVALRGFGREESEWSDER
jgi:flagellar protein FliJ